MKEIINTAYVAEVKEGKTVYFKEYTVEGGRIIAREEVISTNIDHSKRDYGAESTFQSVQLAKHICDLLNGSRMSKKTFFEQLDKEHRYLQGEFTQLCLEWFRHCASDKYGVDGRNQWCHDLGVKIDKIT